MVIEGCGNDNDIVSGKRCTHARGAPMPAVHPCPRCTHARGAPIPPVHPCPRSTHARGASTPVELGIFQFLALSLKMHIPLSWTNLFLCLNVKMSPSPFHRFRCNKHNITWPHCVTLEDVGIVICCCPWTTKGHTHRWRQIHVRSHVSRLVFLFSSPKNILQ